MVALPADTPVTTPPLVTVATAVLLLVQLPPVVASARVVVEPVHTVDAPVMVATPGVAFTVIGWVTVVEQPPPNVTV
jgi:hypothetical protein